MTQDIAAAIAVTRFGLGARAGDIERASGNPQAFLRAQIRSGGAPQLGAPAASSSDRLIALREIQRARRTARTAGDAKDPNVQMLAKQLRANIGADFLSRAQFAATTEDGFAERWALFWANHFTVSALKFDTASLIGPFEQEAIRPNVFGRFEDLLLASTRHPAMLLYLDQAQSVGPNSPLARRAAAHGRRPPGLNENLGREVMELHTVGLAAGYSQADVTELARALTGWSLGRPDDPAEPQGFMFRPFAHEPGVRTIMGRRYPDDGEGQAQAVLADLAASPFTARHLAGEIARHFVRDDPPPTLVEQLSRRWMATGGDLAAVAEALIAAPESWDPTPGKFKTPYEFLASSWRAAGVVPDTVGPVNHALTTLGQRPFAAPSPKGWPDSEAAWCDPDGIVKRMAWSEDFAQHAVGERDPVQLADMALGGRLGGAARLAVGRAETRAEGLSILLMSPEFQRR